MSASPPSGSSSEGITVYPEFMAFVGDEASFATLRTFADRQGFPPSVVQTGGPDLIAQILENAAAPKLLLVDIDGQTDPTGMIARIASKCGNESRLIAVGMANDVGLYRRMIAAGASDYLVKPLGVESLAQTYTTILRGGNVGAKEAKIVLMIGVRGGAGATTIAVNSGWILSHKLKAHVALFDLDLQHGTSALALDLEPGRGLRDMVASPQRVDSLMVASSMVAASEHFSVLGAEESVDDIVPIDSNAIIALIKEMRSNYDYVIIDMPRSMLATQRRLLAMAHEIILISELSLAGIRDTLRVKTALSTLGGATNLTVVASRVTAPYQGQIEQAVFEKSAQVKISLFIPDDPKTVAQASNAGKALVTVAPNAPITKAMLELAMKLSGKSTAASAKPSLWRRFWGPPHHHKDGEHHKDRKTEAQAAKEKS